MLPTAAFKHATVLSCGTDVPMIHSLSEWLTSYLELRAAHSSELAVDRVNFFDKRYQDGVTDPLQKTQISYQMRFSCLTQI